MRFLLKAVILLFFTCSSLFAQSDIQFRVNSKFITGAFNEALSHLVNENGYLKEQLPDQSQKFELKLDPEMTVEDPRYFGEKILGLNLSGKSSLDFFLKQPSVQAKINLKEPIFSLSKDKTKLRVELNVELENYKIAANQLWFKENGISNANLADENTCFEMIKNGTYWEASVVDKYQPRLEDFSEELNDPKYAEHQSKVWARLQNFSVGYDENEEYFDGRNLIKLQMIGEINLTINEPTLKILHLSHNLDKADGGKLKINLGPENIVIPPIFFRTKFAAVDDQGFMLKDDNGNQVWSTRCTPVDLEVAKAYATSLLDDLTKNLYTKFTKEMSESIVKNINETIAKQNITKIPQSATITGSNGYLENDFLSDINYNISKEMEAGFYDQIAGILGQFYQYRATIGLSYLAVENDGKSLEAGVIADLSIDNDHLIYREMIGKAAKRGSKSQFKKHDAFKFENRGEQFALAVSGKMLQKMINLLTTRILDSQLPDWLELEMNEHNYSVDDKGYITLEPKLTARQGRYSAEPLRFSLQMKIRPYIVNVGNRYILKADTIIPNGKEIIRGLEIKGAMKPKSKFWAFLTAPNRWAANVIFRHGIAPVAGSDFVVDRALGHFLGEKMRDMINDFRNNRFEMDITNEVEANGIIPHAINFTQDGHMAIYLSLDSAFYNNHMKLNKIMNDIKNKITNEQ